MEECVFGKKNIVKLCSEDKQAKIGGEELVLGRWRRPCIYALISEARFRQHEVFQTPDARSLLTCIKLHSGAKAQVKLNSWRAWAREGTEPSSAKIGVG